MMSFYSVIFIFEPSFTDPCTCAHNCKVRLFSVTLNLSSILDMENITVALTALWKGLSQSTCAH